MGDNEKGWVAREQGIAVYYGEYWNTRVRASRGWCRRGVYLAPGGSGRGPSGSKDPRIGLQSPNTIHVIVFGP